MTRRRSALFLSAVAAAALVQLANPAAPTASAEPCDPAYPDFCIAPGPPDLDCSDVDGTSFRVLPPDPHRFYRDGNGIGCEPRR